MNLTTINGREEGTQVTKRCCMCEKHKLLADFNKYSQSPDGYQPACRDCKLRTLAARPKGDNGKGLVDDKDRQKIYGWVKRDGSLPAGFKGNKLSLNQANKLLSAMKFVALEAFMAQSGIAVVEPPEEGETQETQQYWQQYLATRQDPEYKAEQERKKREVVAPLRGGYDPKKHSPADPSDPDAYVPPYVRFAKRKLVAFTCPITGWKETSWIQPINGGKVRLVGELTLDHRLARSKNGRTTDENTRMICGLANGKKGNRDKTDEQIRANLVNNWKIVEPPAKLLEAMLEFGVREYKI